MGQAQKKEIDHIGYVSPHYEAEGANNTPDNHGYNERADQEVITAFTVVRDAMVGRAMPSEAPAQG